MQVSVEVTTEVSQFVKTSESSQEKPVCEILSEKLQAEYEEEQQAIKELDALLEPAIIAANNGELSNKTPDEILQGVMKTVLESQK